MFQGIPQGALQIAQGATLYVLNRKDFSVDTASVLGVSQPHISKASQGNPVAALQRLVVDISLSFGNETTSVEYPVNGQSANYPEKGWFISPDRLAVTREIEAMRNTSKQFLSQMPWHEKVVRESDGLLMQLNPEKKAEAEQAEKIMMLENRLAEMNGKFDQMVSLLSAAIPRNVKTKKEETL